jgi:hypothetical protein
MGEGVQPITEIATMSTTSIFVINGDKPDFRTWNFPNLLLILICLCWTSPIIADIFKVTLKCVDLLCLHKIKWNKLKHSKRGITYDDVLGEFPDKKK